MMSPQHTFVTTHPSAILRADDHAKDAMYASLCDDLHGLHEFLRR